MNYPLDAFNSIGSPVHMFLCFPLPHHQAQSLASAPVTVVKELSTRSMFSFCYDMLDPALFFFFTLSRIRKFSLCFCIVLLLTSGLPAMSSLIFYPVSYPPCIIFTSFHHCFLSYTFQSLALHYITFLSLSPSSPFC